MIKMSILGMNEIKRGSINGLRINHLSGWSGVETVGKVDYVVVVIPVVKGDGNKLAHEVIK